MRTGSGSGGGAKAMVAGLRTCGVSLEAKAGAVTCVMGANGVGKTSLLKAIVGLHPITGGQITLGEQDLGRVQRHQIARAGLGYVPQGRMIFPRLTVEENLKTGFACLRPAKPE